MGRRRSGQIATRQNRLSIGSSTSARSLIRRLSARSTLSRETPTRDGRSVRRRVNVLGRGRRWQRLSIALRILEQRETALDREIGWVEIGSPGIRVDGIVDLIVARLVKASEVEPDFADERVESDSARVGIQRVSVLVDLVVEHTNRAPKGGIPTIPVDGLLVCLVCLVELLATHKGSTKQVPTLGIRRV